MNLEILNAICTAFQLGKCLSDASPCTGGLLHQTWKFVTTNGEFVVKTLNSDVIQSAAAYERYRTTEIISQQFSHCTSVISALTHDQDPLFKYDNKVIMVFPFINARVLKPEEITFEQVTKIATALSKIHTANLELLNAPSVEETPLLQHYGEKDFLRYPAIHQLYLQSTNAIKIIANACQENQKILQNNLLISHRDFDPKNVLWNVNNEFFIIDWEAAGWINKTKDFVATAIYWSLDKQYKINLDYLRQFTSAYHLAINKDEISAGFYGLLGDWLGWLDFNLQRILQHPSDHPECLIGQSEAQNTLTALPLMLQQFSEVLKTIQSI